MQCKFISGVRGGDPVGLFVSSLNSTVRQELDSSSSESVLDQSSALSPVSGLLESDTGGCALPFAGNADVL